MNKFTISLIVSVSMALMFFAGYRIGDSRGFEAGYKAGYIYDCQAEVKELRQQHEDLKKAVDFADQKSRMVQFKNAQLEYSRQHYQDSLKNVGRVKHLNDSIAKLPKERQGELAVNPYTGEVRTTTLGILRQLREAQQK